MGILDGLLGNAAGNIDIADLASKVGLTPDDLKNGAESMLSKLAGGSHDAASAATATAAETGISLDSLTSLLPTLAASFGHADVGGLLGSLQGSGGLLSSLDKDGDGNPLNDIAGMAKGLFGGKA
jgi:hypothetical protein